MDRREAIRERCSAVMLGIPQGGFPMSELSPRLALPLLMPDQAQKHVTVNESLLKLDALVQPVALSATLETQPASPAQGAVYILPPGASGSDWGAMPAGSLAVFRDGFWGALQPQPGWQVRVQDENAVRIYDDAQAHWMRAVPKAMITQGAMGASTWFEVIEAGVAALSGESLETGLVIPARAIVLGVTVRVIDRVEGAVSFSIGVDGEASKFGGALSVEPGAVNLGVIGPQGFYADTAVNLTANGGAFTAGYLRLGLHIIRLDAPEAGP